ADARVTLDTVLPAALQMADTVSHDVTVFDSSAPPAGLPAGGRYLFWGIRPGSASLPVLAAGGGESAQPAILDWSRTHPLMRFVDLANVAVSRAYDAAPAPWAQMLAETDTGPLIVAGERGDSRCVWVGFPLLESDMPLRVAFPIFLTNALEWLSAKPGAQTGGVIHPGEIVTLAAGPGAGDVTVLRPDGRRDPVAAGKTPGAPLLYDHADRVGVYRAGGSGGETQSFAVALLSPAESQIRPVAGPLVTVTDAALAPGEVSGRAGGSVTVRREVWPYVAAVALLILCGEWWFFHRRLGG
ncbi:MAG: hypothetical protein H7Z41_04420, partial [Cytophagales bacterium]|nr:hypothetical protein [Armatimonadota bacterium]